MREHGIENCGELREQVLQKKPQATPSIFLGNSDG